MPCSGPTSTWTFSSGCPVVKCIWEVLRKQAEAMKAREPLMAPLVDEAVLQHSSFSEALLSSLAAKLGGGALPASWFAAVFREALELGGHAFMQATLEDLMAVEQRDPATHSVVQVLIYYKGYKALAAYRLSHALWTAGRADLALAVQARVTEVFGLDIHPGAVLGGGLMIDHGTGVVIGETAVVGKDCTFLHGVTLGGTGTSPEWDRHPKVGNNVFLGCGVTVLGNIRIGDHCKVGAGSLVLKPLPDGATAVGSPAIVKSLDARYKNAEAPERSASSEAMMGLDVVAEPLHGPTEPGRDGGGEEVVETWSGRWVPKEWHTGAEAILGQA